jgi:AcrR family transcriptional regulator
MARISKPPEERKEEILDAAAKLFSANGVYETSVNEIVREVGVAQGLFYYYFKSKDELIEAVSDKYAEKIISIFNEKIRRKDLSALEKLKMFFSFTDESEVRKNSNLIEYIHDKNRIELHERISSKATRKFAELLKYVIEQGITEGIFHVDNPEVASQFLVVGFGHLHEAVELDPDPEKLLKWAEGALDIVKRVLGIRKELKVTDIFPEHIQDVSF